MNAQLREASGPLPSFEVATIRPSAAGNTPRLFIWGPARLTIQNHSLKEIVKFAYGINSDLQLASDPKWVDAEKFDIEAKAEDSQVEALKKLPLDERMYQWQLMLQSLLDKRFKLKVSYQTRELPVYALVVAKDGPKLTEVQGLKLVDGRLPPPPDPGAKLPPGTHLPNLKTGKGRLEASAFPMSAFSSWMSRQPEAGGRMVLDETELKGSYDFTLRWTPDNADPTFNGDDGRVPAGASSSESFEPSFFTALQEELGLKLKPTQGNVQVLVIDHVERPSEN
jgi:uncharacterized protein (TIGR03435 family)